MKKINGRIFLIYVKVDVGMGISGVRSGTWYIRSQGKKLLDLNITALRYVAYACFGIRTEVSLLCYYCYYLKWKCR